MNWFRVYHDILNDPKFMGLPLDYLGFWTATLCVSSQMKTRGSLPPADEIAFRTRQPIETVLKYVETMVERKHLVRDRSGNLSVYKWEDYQKKSDDVTARTGKAKAKAKKEAAGAAKNEAPVEAERSRERVDPERERSREQVGNVLEEIRGEEKSKSNPSPSPLPSETRTDGRLDSAPPGETGSGAWDHQSCVALALDLFGDRVADSIARTRDSLAVKLDGSSDPQPGRTEPRWDCLAAALRATDARRKRPGAERINDVIGYAMSLALDWMVVGIPPEPVPAEPAKRPGSPPIKFIEVPQGWSRRAGKAATT